MKHRSTADVVDDLRKGGYLVVCDELVDGYLEIAEIQRRVFSRGGPAVLFPNVKDTRFPCVSNLFGSLEQARYLFRNTLENVRRMIELKIDPSELVRRPFRFWKLPFSGLHTIPKKSSRGPVAANVCKLSDLPRIQSWPDDGGPFITLPQVLSADPDHPSSLMHVNLGMYRVQLQGNDYLIDHEVGLHYQIHRGIGVHHQRAMELNAPLKVTITVGGSPAMTLGAVMPLPEGLSELIFAGALSGRRIQMIVSPNFAPVYADADFAISGTIVQNETKAEGPFGDHLGYYSLQHKFPVMKVERVWHRNNAIWPFTVVGRPPQEDTTFGALIHELTGPIIPTVIPGIKAVHAVDAAGVHPLLLAIGSERYMPFARDSAPAELLTQANAILGNGQLSLAKYLMILNHGDVSSLNIEDIGAFVIALLERIDWRRDLHFQTQTTIDTLDYSGEGMNRGSKVVMAAVGPRRRELPVSCEHLKLPEAFKDARVVLPGVLAVTAPKWSDNPADANSSRQFCAAFTETDAINQFPWITLVDDSAFAARSLNNWLWTTFTRSNPAVDIDGIGASTVARHWGCKGSLVVDARPKPHHAPPLVEDPDVSRKVDALAARGGAISRWI
jgi:4-hydroxy-3-polyprenylbenzoate decarboxylase